MISFQKKENGLIRRYPIVGGRRLSNYWWSIVIFLGGCGFLFTGISSFFNRNLFLIIPTSKIENVNLSTKSIINRLPLWDTQDVKTYSSMTSSHLDKRILIPTSFQIGDLEPMTHLDSPTLISPLDRTDEQLITEFQENCFTDDMACTGGKKKLVSSILPFQVMQNLFLSFFPETPTIRNGIDKILYSKIEGDFKNKIYSISIGDVSSNIANGIPILPFFPQGLVLSFYGFLGLCFSFHLWFTLFWKIGAGFNEVNAKEKSIRIFRWGKPGKNRRIDLKYSNELINTIKIEFFPRPALFLCIKGDKKIPLTRLGEFIPLEDLETQAAELTSLLQVPLEIEEK